MSIITLNFVRMELMEVLKQHGNYLKIAGIEKEIGCPKTTLNIYLKTGYLPNKWKVKLTQWVETTFK